MRNIEIFILLTLIRQIINLVISSSEFLRTTFIDTNLITCENKCKKLTFSAPNVSEETILPAGNYSYPFEFVLPFGIPGSFEGPIYQGYVRYWLKATIDIPWKFDPEYKTLFTVASVLDLRTVPNVMVCSILEQRSGKTGLNACP